MQTSYKKHILLYFTIVIISLICVAGINFFIDPGKIYNTKKTLLDKYITVLLNSSTYGVVQDGWNERDVKVALAKQVNHYECAIIGSSHAMQLGVYTTPALKNLCKSVMNFSVSGGALEDIVVFTQLLHQNDNIKKVIIDIDPWSLKFNMDTRWKKNKIIYDDFIKNTVVKENQNYDNYKWHLVKNLINLEYFIESLKKIKKYSQLDILENQKIRLNRTSNYIVGFEYPGTLSDGSHVYSKGYIKKQRNYIFNKDLDKADYKISGKLYTEEAISLLREVVRTFKKLDKQVLLLLTPYHPDVFRQNLEEVQYIQKIEVKIKEFAELNGVNVLGSYNPNIIGCTNSEFLDYMHARIECLNKINFKIDNE